MKQTSTLGDFLTGLDGPDTVAVGNDVALYGNAFVEVVDGKKRRLAPCEWPAVVKQDEPANVRSKEYLATCGGMRISELFWGGKVTANDIRAAIGLPSISDGDKFHGGTIAPPSEENAA